MKIIKVALIFNEYPNTIFIGQMMLNQDQGPELKFLAKNPFTGENCLMFYKGVSKKRENLFYYWQGNKWGEILGG